MSKIQGIFRCGSVFQRNAQGADMQSPFGGTYTPGHMKNGVFVSGCWRGTLFVETGRKEGQTIHLTVWNGQNSPAGQGSADRFAKEVAPGTVLYLEAELDVFKRALTDPVTGAQIAFSNGQIAEHKLTGFKYIPRTMYIIKNSHKFLGACYSRPLNVIDFWSAIPVIPGMADYNEKQQQMAQVWKARREMAFVAGSQHYGVATVKALTAGFQQMNNPPAGYVRPQTAGTGIATGYATVATASPGATGVIVDPNVALPPNPATLPAATVATPAPAPAAAAAAGGYVAPPLV